MFEHSVDGAFVFSGFNRLSLVELFLTSRYGYFEFGVAAFVDEKPDGDNSVARLLGRLGDTVDFLALQQQLAVAMCGVVVVRAETVFSYIHVLHPHFMVLNHAEGVGESGLALTYRFDFGPGKHYTGGEGLVEQIVETGPAVLYVDVVSFH